MATQTVRIQHLASSLQPPASNRPVFGCILSQFPRYDEAFILRELVELSKGPWELVIFSLRPCRDRLIHEQAKALQPKTVYAPFVWSVRVWRSHAHFLRRVPGRYARALGWVISRHWTHPLVLLKTLFLFPKTVHFAKLAAGYGIQHLHAFWATYPASSAMVMRLLLGLPYSLSGHAHDIYTTNPALAEKIHNARFVVTCTEHNRRCLLSLVNGQGDRAEAGSWKLEAGTVGSTGVENPEKPARQPSSFHPSPRIVINYHGVDLSRFSPSEKPDDGMCRILAVGSLLPCKGFETLIDSCRLLAMRGVRIRCTIAGGGPLERSLRILIARQALESVIEIAGYVSQEMVAGFYQRAHLVVLPLVSKIHWGIPNVLIEALATKTPVIACALPSMAELIEHGTSGWIVPEHDPRALAEAIAALWADRPLRQRLADAGYRRVIERFSLERTGQQLRQLFQAYGNGAGRQSTVDKGDRRVTMGRGDHSQTRR